MQVKREEDNPLFTRIVVRPWPDVPFAQDVAVIQYKRSVASGQSINDVHIRYREAPVTIEHAYEFAQAILRACDIARRLQEEGSIVLEEDHAKGRA